MSATAGLRDERMNGTSYRRCRVRACARSTRGSDDVQITAPPTGHPVWAYVPIAGWDPSGLGRRTDRLTFPTEDNSP